MKNWSRMPTDRIYRELASPSDGSHGYDRRFVEHLVDAYAAAGNFLAHAIKSEGAEWSDNFMREWARCFRHIKSSNTASPGINELVFRKYPHLRKCKLNQGPDLFDDDQGDD